jgi:hypothetical protein
MSLHCHNTVCHYAAFRNTACSFDECHHAECHYTDCHDATCHYAECRNTACRFAECRGALSLLPPVIISLIFSANVSKLQSHIFFKIFAPFHLTGAFSKQILGLNPNGS